MIARPLLLAVALLLLGCDEEPAATTKRKQQPFKAPPVTLLEDTAPATAADLQAAIDANGSVTFLSYNGQWIGMDGDSDYTFFPGGELHRFGYGMSMIGYRGSYEVDGDGIITIDLPEHPHDWPPLHLRRDGGDLLLFYNGEDVNGWPHRQIPPEQEAQQRQTIAARGAPPTTRPEGDAASLSTSRPTR